MTGRLYDSGLEVGGFRSHDGGFLILPELVVMLDLSGRGDEQVLQPTGSLGKVVRLMKGRSEGETREETGARTVRLKVVQ